MTMKCRIIFFKLIRKGFLVVRKVFDCSVTWVKFFCLCEEFHDFKTKGIPYIDVSNRESSCIRIGKGFRMNNGMAGNQIGFGKSPCVLQAVGGNITIGDNVGMSQTAILALADVSIGNNVLLGGGVKIYTSDFHSLNYKWRRCRKKDSENKACAPIAIGDDCFIGAGSIILKGVTIGARSVVGAGSVVTKNIPADEIWAGNPAKFIRKNEVFA